MEMLRQAQPNFCSYRIIFECYYPEMVVSHFAFSAGCSEPNLGRDLHGNGIVV